MAFFGAFSLRLFQADLFGYFGDASWRCGLNKEARPSSMGLSKVERAKALWALETLEAVEALEALEAVEAS